MAKNAEPHLATRRSLLNDDGSSNRLRRIVKHRHKYLKSKKNSGKYDVFKRFFEGEGNPGNDGAEYDGVKLSTVVEACKESGSFSNGDSSNEKARRECSHFGSYIEVNSSPLESVDMPTFATASNKYKSPAADREEVVKPVCGMIPRTNMLETRHQRKQEIVGEGPGALKNELQPDYSNTALAFGFKKKNAPSSISKSQESKSKKKRHRRGKVCQCSGSRRKNSTKSISSDHFMDSSSDEASAGVVVPRFTGVHKAGGEWDDMVKKIATTPIGKLEPPTPTSTADPSTPEPHGTGELPTISFPNATLPTTADIFRTPTLSPVWKRQRMPESRSDIFSVEKDAQKRNTSRIIKNTLFPQKSKMLPLYSARLRYQRPRTTTTSFSLESPRKFSTETINYLTSKRSSSAVSDCPSKTLFEWDRKILATSTPINHLREKTEDELNDVIDSLQTWAQITQDLTSGLIKRTTIRKAPEPDKAKVTKPAESKSKPQLKCVTKNISGVSLQSKKQCQKDVLLVQPKEKRYPIAEAKKLRGLCSYGSTRSQSLNESSITSLDEEDCEKTREYRWVKPIQNTRSKKICDYSKQQLGSDLQFPKIRKSLTSPLSPKKSEGEKLRKRNINEIGKKDNNKLEEVFSETRKERELETMSTKENSTTPRKTWLEADFDEASLQELLDFDDDESDAELYKKLLKYLKMRALKKSEQRRKKMETEAKSSSLNLLRNQRNTKSKVTNAESKKKAATITKPSTQNGKFRNQSLKKNDLEKTKNLKHEDIHVTVTEKHTAKDESSKKTSRRSSLIRKAFTIKDSAILDDELYKAIIAKGRANPNIVVTDTGSPLIEACELIQAWSSVLGTNSSSQSPSAGNSKIAFTKNKRASGDSNSRKRTTNFHSQQPKCIVSSQAFNSKNLYELPKREKAFEEKRQKETDTTMNEKLKEIKLEWEKHFGPKKGEHDCKSIELPRGHPQKKTINVDVREMTPTKQTPEKGQRKKEKYGNPDLVGSKNQPTKTGKSGPLKKLQNPKHKKVPEVSGCWRFLSRLKRGHTQKRPPDGHNLRKEISAMIEAEKNPRITHKAGKEKNKHAQSESKTSDVINTGQNSHSVLSENNIKSVPNSSVRVTPEKMISSPQLSRITSEFIQCRSSYSPSGFIKQPSIAEVPETSQPPSIMDLNADISSEVAAQETHREMSNVHQNLDHTLLENPSLYPVTTITSSLTGKHCLSDHFDEHSKTPINLSSNVSLHTTKNLVFNNPCYKPAGNYLENVATSTMRSNLLKPSANQLVPILEPDAQLRSDASMFEYTIKPYSYLKGKESCPASPKTKHSNELKEQGDFRHRNSSFVGVTGELDSPIKLKDFTPYVCKTCSPENSISSFNRSHKMDLKDLDSVAEFNLGLKSPCHKLGAHAHICTDVNCFWSSRLNEKVHSLIAPKKRKTTQKPHSSMLWDSDFSDWGNDFVGKKKLPLKKNVVSKDALKISSKNLGENMVLPPKRWSDTNIPINKKHLNSLRSVSMWSFPERSPDEFSDSYHVFSPKKEIEYLKTNNPLSEKRILTDFTSSVFKAKGIGTKMKTNKGKNADVSKPDKSRSKLCTPLKKQQDGWSKTKHHRDIKEMKFRKRSYSFPSLQKKFVKPCKVLSKSIMLANDGVSQEKVRNVKNIKNRLASEKFNLSTNFISTKPKSLAWTLISGKSILSNQREKLISPSTSVDASKLKMYFKSQEQNDEERSSVNLDELQFASKRSLSIQCGDNRECSSTSDFATNVVDSLIALLGKKRPKSKGKPSGHPTVTQPLARESINVGSGDDSTRHAAENADDFPVMTLLAMNVSERSFVREAGRLGLILEMAPKIQQKNDDSSPGTVSVSKSGNLVQVQLRRASGLGPVTYNVRMGGDTVNKQRNFFETQNNLAY